MKQNKYDDAAFFAKYSDMARSRQGLAGAAEWPLLRDMMPELRGVEMLDLGCGFGWHCIWAAEHGAKRVVGVDISQNMIARAREMSAAFAQVSYLVEPMEDLEFAQGEFDFILSSLALHYVADFSGLCAKLKRWIRPGGHLVFSVEHPIFTAQGPQEWALDEAGEPMHWPVDDYFEQGKRDAVFLGEPVVKYHRTLQGYLQPLLENGFSILDIAEPEVSPEQAAREPDFRHERRRPMFLLISAQAQ